MLLRALFVLACVTPVLAQEPEPGDGRGTPTPAERLAALRDEGKALAAEADGRPEKAALESRLEELHGELERLRETYEDPQAREPTKAEVRLRLRELQEQTEKRVHERRLDRYDRLIDRWASFRDRAAAQALELADGDATRRELENLRDAAQEAYLEVRARRGLVQKIHLARRDILFFLRSENLFLRGESVISTRALEEGLRDLRKLPRWLVSTAGAVGSYFSFVDPARRGGLLRLFGAAAVLAVALLGIGRWIARREKKERRSALGRLLGALAREYGALARALFFGGVPLLASATLTGLPAGTEIWLRRVALVLGGFFAARWLLRLLLPNLREEVARRLRLGLGLLLWLSVIALPVLYALDHLGYENRGAREFLWLVYQVLMGAVVLFVLLKKSFLLGLLPDPASGGLGRLLNVLVRILQPVAVLLVPTLLVLSVLRFDILAGLITRFAVGAVAGAVTGALLYQFACTLAGAWLRTRRPREAGQAAMERHEALEGATLFAIAVVFLLFSIWLFLNLSGSDLDELRAFLDAPLPLQGGEGKPITWWNVILGVALLWFFVAATKHAKNVLRHQFLSGTKLDSGVQYTITTIVGYVLVGIGAYLALTRVFDLSNLGTIVAALSVGIGFGLQEIVSNFVSGLILLFERPLKVGDLVEVGDHEGVVKQINIRATTVLTRDNVFLLVPNREFIGQTVVNYAHSDPRMRLRLAVGVSYSSDTRKVKEVLLDIARNHDEVLQQPPPDVWFTGFGSSSLDFELLVWIARPPRKNPIASSLCFEIFDQFAENGIQIPFPQRDLHLKSAIPVRHVEDER